MVLRTALAAVVLALLACGSGGPPSPPAPPAPRALILVSIDGFRRDYLDLHEAPNLARFADEGVRADALVSVFPTETFPNHYTIVTGRRPASHGVIGNTMYDPVFDETFRIRDGEQVRDGRWWGAEPLWATAGRQGLVSATMFWPGSEAEIAGRRPTYWTPYDYTIPGEERVRRVLAWLDLPRAERPSFITLYFNRVDHEGHEHGPHSSAVAEAVLEIDGHVGALFEGLEERGIAGSTDVVILSDHGMVARSHERVIVLEELLGADLLDDLHVVTLSPVLGIRADDARQERVLERLRGAHPNLAVWAREDVPARFHFRHPRVPDVVGLADPGWRIVFDADHLERVRRAPAGGTHGYDPADPRMHAFFAARGPSFRERAVVPAFESVHLYELFARVLGIEPAENDGDPEALTHLLAGAE